MTDDGNDHHDPKMAIDAAEESDTRRDDAPAIATPEVAAMLRNPMVCEATLRILADAMTPPRANPEIWEPWLSGGVAPFGRRKLEHPDPGGQSIQRSLDRQSQRVAHAKMGIHNAQRAVDAAKLKMAKAERALVEAQSLDAALVQYAIDARLAAIIEPMFAMGPGWVVMRAISSYISPASLENDLQVIKNSDRRRQREEIILQERRTETDRILDVLDRWGGDDDFEYELRYEILELVNRYAERECKDRSSRTNAALRATLADPELRRHYEEILAGMVHSSDSVPSV